MIMNIYENKLYTQDVATVAALPLPWEKLQDRSILISGAGGLVGSFLSDVLMYRNSHYSLNCTVFAMGRNEAKARERFADYWDDALFRFVCHDINLPYEGEKVDYIIHLASNTHPMAYATDPIGTITTNVFGLYYLLEFASVQGVERFAFASSNEIYGENRGDVEFFDENYCGYINANTMRAGYPESKRCGEALCQAYLAQKGVDVVIPRLTRSYGPTMLMSDTKAISQFIRKAIAGQDIVLKSDGTQYYSYTYVADAVSGLLTVLLLGEKGQAYNIAHKTSDIMLKDLARIIAETTGKEVIFELPDATEKAGYSTATKARLTGDRIQALGWQPQYDIQSGIKRTISILMSKEE